ncbi:hypothetical protein MCOR27_008743 [Pyricularia oryzae]|nr:hypothetical protein MCOR27_008743 [Pyricularia oryzae]KAI6497272.1 hypothetical protein MCOR11_004512 [Pyricularia oryzae]
MSFAADEFIQGALLRDAAVALAALTNELARGVGGRASGGDGRGGGGGSRGGARVQKPPGTGPQVLASSRAYIDIMLYTDLHLRATAHKAAAAAKAAKNGVSGGGGGGGRRRRRWRWGRKGRWPKTTRRPANFRPTTAPPSLSGPSPTTTSTVGQNFGGDSDDGGDDGRTEGGWGEVG